MFTKKQMDQLYENQIATEEIKSEAKQEWIVESINADDGIFLNIKGAEFPYKGLATPEAIVAINVIKKLILEGIGVISIARLWSKNYQIKVVTAFCRIGIMVMKPYILKPRYQTVFTREFICLTKNFLEELGTNKEDALLCAKMIGHVFEYDSAYRFRLQDMFHESTKEKLYLNPIKEVNRLVSLSTARDYEIVTKKVIIVGRLLTLGLLIPRVRKAFKLAIKKSAFDSLCFDVNDLYWTAQRIDYKFRGLSSEERMELIKKYKVPKYTTINEPK